MRAERVREFVARDWAAVAALERRLWAERFASSGGRETFAAGQALLEHARRLDPRFPGERQRRDDLREHVRLEQLLDQASRALAGR